MSKFIVDLWLDGYESEQEAEKAQEEFIYEQLNMTASSVTITKVSPALDKAIEGLLKALENTLAPFLVGEDSPALRQFHVKRINEALDQYRLALKESEK